MSELIRRFNEDSVWTGNTEVHSPCFSIAKNLYFGKRKTLIDGTEVKAFDTIGELHVRNTIDPNDWEKLNPYTRGKLLGYIVAAGMCHAALNCDDDKVVAYRGLSDIARPIFLESIGVPPEAIKVSPGHDSLKRKIANERRLQDSNYSYSQVGTIYEFWLSKQQLKSVGMNLNQKLTSERTNDFLTRCLGYDLE